MDLQRLKYLLAHEMDFTPTTQAMDRLLALATEVTYKRGDVIVSEGTLNKNVHILADGVIAYIDFDGDRERTYALGTPGTTFMSMHPFTLNLPSYYRIEACCDSTVMTIKNKDFWSLCKSDNDVAVWQLNLAYGQLAFFEHINSTIQNGSARERYLALLTKRPEIIEKVSLKTIASYLRITPEYLSRLRNRLKKDK